MPRSRKPPSRRKPVTQRSVSSPGQVKKRTQSLMVPPPRVERPGELQATRGEAVPQVFRARNEGGRGESFRASGTGASRRCCYRHVVGALDTLPWASPKRHRHRVATGCRNGRGASRPPLGGLLKPPAMRVDYYFSFWDKGAENWRLWLMKKLRRHRGLIARDWVLQSSEKTNPMCRNILLIEGLRCSLKS